MGRSVLVTGASSGIGRACALHLDALGFCVFGTVRKESDADELRQLSSGSVTPVMMDVTDPASIAAAAEQVGQAVGEAGLYGLVNNAGVGFMAPLEFVSLEDVRWMFDVNFFGVLAVAQAFLPLLRQARGRLVNVSSTASVFVMAFHGPYSAAKTALNALSDALRLELRPHGVSVSIAVYGNVVTPMWVTAFDRASAMDARYSDEVWELYGEQYRRARDFVRRGGQIGITPEEAARSISHAFTAKRPRIRYYVGPDARFYGFASRFLSGRLRDWIVRRSAGLA